MSTTTFPKGMEEEKLMSLFAQAENLGLRLELTDGGITWETFPGFRHQEIIRDILVASNSGRGSEGGCECIQVPDVDIVFPDGTVKRPDPSVWCKRPEELEGFVHAIPEAVIEIVSPGYEDKDLVFGPPIFLRNGVKDVIVFHRAKAEVHHWSPAGHRIVPSPTVFELACGCQITV
ncbi:Uma2 family endonuclease [bacterium]|nr:MAG: Uma2 family endonuclease [bacterium]